MFKLHCNLGRIFNFAKSNKQQGQEAFASIISKRYLPQPRKRFYARVNVVPEAKDSEFSIELDGKKLKTPGKNILQIPNETLAYLISEEWASQKKTIAQHSMHFTALLNTIIDNPFKKEKDSLIEDIFHNLHSDSLFYRLDEDLRIGEIQKEKWDPLVQWFENIFDSKFYIKGGSLDVPNFTDDFKNKLTNHLNSYSIECLYGLNFAIKTINSVILTFCALNDVITCEEAVKLSRLEVDFQTKFWGNVEWAHDIELEDSLARFSSAIVFIGIHSKYPFCKNSETVSLKA